MKIDKKPNIVFLMSDQHRFDHWGAAGHKTIQTPYLDDLAGQGVLFNGAYCSSPLCMPVRSTIVSGEESHAHGVIGHGTGIINERLRQECFPWVLRQLGYQTGFVGKHHFFNQQHKTDLREKDPLLKTFGFTHIKQCCGKLDSLFTDCHYTEFLKKRNKLQIFREDYTRRKQAPLWDHIPSPLDEDETSDAWVGQQGIEMINQFSSDQPYFIWISFPGPHDPWDAPGKYATMYQGEDFDLPHNFNSDLTHKAWRHQKMFDSQQSSQLTETNYRQVLTQYAGMISLIDSWIGRIVSLLSEKGDLNNTYIVYSGDHGEMMGSFKLFLKTLFDEPSSRIPFLVQGPGVAQGERCDSLFSSIDFYNTFISLAGGQINSSKPSRDLTSLFSNPQSTWDQVCFSELDSWKMVRTERYKVTYDPSPTYWGQQVSDAPKGIQEIYDMHDDPYEERNLVNEPNFETIKSEHIQLILNHLIDSRRLECIPNKELFKL